MSGFLTTGKFSDGLRAYSGARDNAPVSAHRQAEQPIGSLAIGSHMPLKTENYQAKVSIFARDAMAGRPILTGPLRLHVRAFVSIPRTLAKCRLDEIRRGLYHPCKRPDVTNIIKLAEDALHGIVFEDDKQVVRGADDTGRYFSFRPRLEIDVEPLTHCQLQADELAGDGDPAHIAADLFQQEASA
ncbi:MAG: RusA family crossover junction endodeoxyribonuclease [Alphaproteobacteria bacterium]|nr:RusA family crossover junction endodeoxyribonuclease [Alphaproteobacteria bacterium]